MASAGWVPGGRPTRGFARAIGCLFVFLVGLVVLAVVAAAWTLASLSGIVAAPHWLPWLGVLVLVAVLWFAVHLLRSVRRMTVPVDDLVDAAAHIERGDYSARVEERGPPQVRSLARAFNQMSARLADVDAQRRTFLAEMAHELRTPLTVLQGQLEAVVDGVYPADTEHLEPLLDQTLALERLVDDLRTVALADAGALALVRTRTDLAALIEEQVDAFRPSAPQLIIGSELASDLPLVEVDPGRIAQVLRNLLSNAIRHTPAGGRVTVSAARDAGTVIVAVRDTGTGIAPELLPRIFDRFVKGSGPSGSGLGLAIAHDLVVAHGGTISAESTVGGGTTIRFSLPLG